MDKIKEKINIVNILTLFIFIQPVIDLLTSLTVRFTNSSLTIGIILRTLVMIISGLYVVFKIPNTKLKKITLGFYAVFAVYIISFLGNSVYHKGVGALFAECKGIVKTFYLPLMLLSYINIYRANNKKIESEMMSKVFLLYSAMIFVPTCLGIYFFSYNNIYNGLGSVGFFYSANEIGGILGILLIYTLNKVIKEKLDVKNLIAIELLMFSILYIGTKVPIVSFMLAVAYLVAIYALRILLDKENKNTYLTALKRLAVIVLCIIPLSVTTPVAKNFTSLNDKFSSIQNEINPKEEDKKEEEKQFSVKEQLKKYTETMISGRNILLENSKVRYNESSISTKLLGYGYIEKKAGQYLNIKTVEMDYFDILFSQGVIGFAIFFAPIIYFAIVCMKMLFANFKKCIFTNAMIVDIYAICIGLLISFVAGHVIVAPAVNIYIVVAITRLFLTMNKECKE